MIVRNLIQNDKSRVTYCKDDAVSIERVDLLQWKTFGEINSKW